MWLTARDDSLLAIPRIDAVKVFDTGGRRNTVVVKSLDFVHTAANSLISPGVRCASHERLTLSSRKALTVAEGSPLEVFTDPLVFASTIIVQSGQDPRSPADVIRQLLRLRAMDVPELIHEVRPCAKRLSFFLDRPSLIAGSSVQYTAISRVSPGASLYEPLQTRW
jgi:hypothetical protein